MDAKHYSDIDKHHLGIANILIDLVDKFGEERYEVIIEVGPGPGNTTKLLATQFKHGKIFALDVDPNMVGFAKKNQTIDSIEFLLNDLSGDWNSINEKIRKLESKVSMVFSNACINLIKQKSTFVHNLKRLMRANARAYFSVFLYPDLNIKLKGELKEKLGGIVEIPTFVKQMQVWADFFLANGFTVDYNDIQRTQIYYYSGQDLVKLLPFVSRFLDIHMKNGMLFSELSGDVKEKLIKLLWDQFTNGNQKSINWQKLEQDKVSFKFPFTFTVGYIVVKRDNNI